LGNETPGGESYLAFQKYIKELKDRGVILAVCSKNEIENAKEGFTHSDSVLTYADFTSFYANWEPKHHNIEKIAQEINIDLNSLVFIDDNAVERNLVESHLTTVAVPNVGDNVLNFIDYIEQNGYFSIVSLSDDDINRNKFYSENQVRAKEQVAFKNYHDFLSSLLMEAEIKNFTSVYFERITQLINKTNQFNLTTKRYSVTDVESFAKSDDFITLFGKLTDKFGDNGLISIVLGKVEGQKCIIDTWLMSCRVLKRDMEFAMLDILIEECRKRNLTEIYGQYKRTAKNNMVANLYGDMGFELIESNETEGLWKLAINNFNNKELTIQIN
jgi:FkbH-like protein